MILLRSWRWRISLDCEKLSSPDTLRAPLTWFAKVVKVTNITGLWEAELAWYSPSATHLICQGGEGDEYHWTMRSWARLILSECHSPDLPRWWRWRTSLDCEKLSLPDTRRVPLTGFPEVVKVTNITGLWEAELASYSPSATHLICQGGEGDEHHWTVRSWARLILSERHSPDLPRWWRWRISLDYEKLSSPDTLRAPLTWFAKVVKVTNITGLWEAELASYSPSATHLICQGGEGDEYHWTMRSWARLILSECHSPDLPRWWRWRTSLDCEKLSLPDTRRVPLTGFPEVVKVTNITASYSPSATHLICQGGEGDEHHWTVRSWARLILSERHSPDLPRWWRWRTSLDCEKLSSPHTLRAPLTWFAKVVKVTNITGLWEAELASYSPSATHLICQGGEGDEHHWTVRSWACLILAECHSPDFPRSWRWRITLKCGMPSSHGLGIHDFRPTCILPVRPGSCNLSKISWPIWLLCRNLCVFIFNTRSLSCFCKLIAQFQLVNFPNSSTLYVHLCGFQITRRVKQCTTCQRTNYYNTTCHTRYLPGLNCFGYVIHAPQTSECYQNIAKLLTLPSIREKSLYTYYQNIVKLLTLPSII